jgi:hypothetical protein
VKDVHGWYWPHARWIAIQQTQEENESMKPVKDETLDILEKTAVEGAKQILAAFAYQGSDQRYRDNAKIGASAISGFARVRASESNREAIELQVARLSKG